MSTRPSPLGTRRAGAGLGGPAPRRYLILKILLGLLVLAALLIAGALWYTSTAQFANLVRRELVTQIESATGGRVELGAFRWRLLHLEVEADNLTIHGLEPAGEVPYAHLDRLLVRAKIISLFRGKVGLNYLAVDRPTIHIMVFKDGTTNQPVPKKKSTSNTPLDQTINTVFDLQADRAEVNNGRALFNQDAAIPFALAGNDLDVGINYLVPTDQYRASISIADLAARRGKAPAVHSKLSLAALLGRNEATLTDLHFSAGSSTLAAHAHVSSYTDPHWQLAADGTVDLREAEALAGIPGLDRGVVRLDLQGQGTTSVFNVDGGVKVAGATYKGSGVYVNGLSAATEVHLTQDILALNKLQARLSTGGLIEGDAHIDHWLAPTPPPAGGPSAVQPGEKAAATARAARAAGQAVAGATTNPGAKAQVSEGAVNFRLRGFTLPSILSVVAPPKYQHLGITTTANGEVKLHWTGNASDLAADARLALQAPANPPNGDVPLNGNVDVSYAGRTNSVVVRRLDAHTRATQLNVTGGVGLAAGARSSLRTQLTVGDLNEFAKPLAAFGVSKNQVPLTLHGQASFNGMVTGSLAAPDVTGHLAVNNFDVLIPNGQAPTGQATNPAGQTVAVPAPAAAAPTALHIDALVADAEYSPQLISIQSAVVTRGKTQVHASGQLRAHRTRRKGYAFDNDAELNAQATVANAAIPDLLAVAGQSSIPVTGTLNLNVQAGGTLGNLSGGGHLLITGGEAYGEPYQSLNADLTFAGQEVGASQFALLAGGGSVTGNGGFNLQSKRFHAEVQSQGLALENFQSLKKSPIAVRGNLAFNLKGSGTAEHPDAQAAVHLTNLLVASPAGGPPTTGQVDLTAHTEAGSLLADMNAQLNGALARLRAKAGLSGDYPLDAQLNLDHLDINPFLQTFNVTGFRGSTSINGSITAQGPLKNPQRLSADANLSRIAIIAQGIEVGTEGGLHASLRDGIATLAPLHILGGGTDLRAQGRAAVFGTNRLLDAQVNGTANLAVAHTLDRDIDSSGTLSIHFTAANTIERPDLSGAIDFHDANLAYDDLPNGVSHLNGSLVFDQGRLTAQNLHATSGGGTIEVGGFIAYQAGVFADLTLNAHQVRLRYAGGLSTVFNSKLRVQGTTKDILVTGGVLVTRFAILPGLDTSAFSSNGISPPPDPTSFGNHIRLDVHVTSAPQLDINNSYAKLAGDIDLYVRGTAESPSVLGHVSITEGDATFAGTHYVLQHGDIYFTNPVKIDPTIDLEASAHIEDYDVIVGVHGTAEKLTPVFRSEPPLSEQDIFSLLSLGRTQEEQQIYSSQQQAAGVNTAADSILGGALNATLSDRINKLFGGGSVKIDPVFSGAGNSNATARITVQQQISKQGTVTYATNVNSTAQQLIQGQYNITPNVSVVAVRDESGVFSLELKLHQRYR